MCSYPPLCLLHFSRIVLFIRSGNITDFKSTSHVVAFRLCCDFHSYPLLIWINVSQTCVSQHWGLGDTDLRGQVDM